MFYFKECKTYSLNPKASKYLRKQETNPIQNNVQQVKQYSFLGPWILYTFATQKYFWDGKVFFELISETEFLHGGWVELINSENCMFWFQNLLFEVISGSFGIIFRPENS